MLPNYFPDKGEFPEYNAVDAALWFVEAARSYLAYTGDVEFLQNELYPILADIISWHVRGTRHGIQVEPSGLLTSGEVGVQLTWMDAKVDDLVVTPRRGKPVDARTHRHTRRSLSTLISAQHNSRIQVVAELSRGCQADVSFLVI